MPSSPSYSLRDFVSEIEYFREIGVREDLLRAYYVYGSPIASRGAPVLFDFGHLAFAMNRTDRYLASVVNKPSAHYREFAIPKKSGGTRTISAPLPALLECQRWMKTHVLSVFRVSRHAHGFLPKRSILTHLKPHLRRSEILKMDLKEFFPSIKQNRIIALFLHLGYAPNVAFYLSQIACIHGHLPQGAATSPLLSNIIAWRMDNRLGGHARENNLRYTRYADDLVFSGKSVTANFLKTTYSIVRDEGFSFNNSKTRLMQKGERKIITGIDITSGHFRVPRKFRRQIIKECYYLSKFGLLSHIAHENIKNDNYLESLRGRLSFWLFVEPGNKKAKELLDQLS